MAERVSLNRVNLIAWSYFEGNAHAVYGESLPVFTALAHFTSNNEYYVNFPKGRPT
jgi:hypothetical protein